MADRRLGQVERRGQVADADLAALGRADQGYPPDPDRVAERLEHLRQPRRGGLADGLADQRDRARLHAGSRLGRGEELQRGLASLHRHASILTVIYPGWQASRIWIDAYR